MLTLYMIHSSLCAKPVCTWDCQTNVYMGRSILVHNCLDQNVGENFSLPLVSPLFLFHHQRLWAKLKVVLRKIILLWIVTINMDKRQQPNNVFCFVFLVLPLLLLLPPSQVTTKDFWILNRAFRFSIMKLQRIAIVHVSGFH